MDILTVIMFDMLYDNNKMLSTAILDTWFMCIVYKLLHVCSFEGSAQKNLQICEIFKSSSVRVLVYPNVMKQERLLP